MQIPIGLKRTAAMVVLRHGDSFLLLKRAKSPNKGKYVPVGGKLEPFENPLNAALRETYEETGLRLNTVKYCGVLVETSPTDYNWQCNIYVAEIDFIPPPPCDEGTLEWIDFDRVPNVPTPPTDLHIYHYIMAGKPFAFDAVYDENLKLLEMREEIEGKWLMG
jgi:8-oxo-dGTP diphosphatase